MLSVLELHRIAASMTCADFEQQLGPFVLVQRLPDELTQQKALALGAQRTVALSRSEPRDSLSLLFELDDLLVATLPPLEGNEALTVGRLPDCELVVDDPSVSKHHARLTWSEATGQATVTDLSSSNGTLVNGRPAQGPVPMNDGDEVAFGEARFCFLRTRTLHQRLTTGRFKA